MTEKKPLGRLPREAIRMLDIPRPPKDVINAFIKLIDLTGTISDACDELGIVAVIPAYQLPPVNSGQRVVGPALTVRNIARDVQIHKAAQEKINTQGETEAHNLAEPGDVLVLQGVMGCSNMGGQSATIARRQGFIGAVLDATVRDPDQYRSWDWPVWCRGFTPITGKWRMQTVEVNGTVEIRGVACRPGDLVCGDEAGVAIIPREKIAAVLEICMKIDDADNRRKADIDKGVAITDLWAKKYK